MEPGDLQSLGCPHREPVLYLSYPGGRREV
jgi:hypothetical protein